MKLLDKIFTIQTLIAFAIGGIVGIFIMDHVIKTEPPAKRYPIKVQCHWITNDTESLPIFECDSVKGDTCWKDGDRIVAKNIISVTFQ